MTGAEPLDSIDAWRAAHWGQSGACPCGDPIILADTEDWVSPRCWDCWYAMTPKARSEAADAKR